MKYLKWVVFLVLFISLMKYLYHSDKKKGKIEDKYMANGLFIKGEVLEVKKSKNHVFGILLLKVNSLNTGKFIDTPLNKSIYPYKIKNGEAEIYVPIPYGIQKGDKVIIDSDKKIAHYHFVSKNKQDEGNLEIVTEPHDLIYVKNNTTFK